MKHANPSSGIKVAENACTAAGHAAFGHVTGWPERRLQSRAVLHKGDWKIAAILYVLVFVILLAAA